MTPSVSREGGHFLNTLLNTLLISAAEIVEMKQVTHSLFTANMPVRLAVPRNVMLEMPGTF